MVAQSSSMIVNTGVCFLFVFLFFVCLFVCFTFSHDKQFRLNCLIYHCTLLIYCKHSNCRTERTLVNVRPIGRGGPRGSYKSPLQQVEVCFVSYVWEVKRNTRSAIIVYKIHMMGTTFLLSVPAIDKSTVPVARTEPAVWKWSG